MTIFNQIVSQINLQDTIKNNWSFNTYLKDLNKCVIDTKNILKSWKINLDDQSFRLTRKIHCEFYNSEFLYDNLDDDINKKAAYIAEIFRNKEISKNCADLDENSKKISKTNFK